MAGASIKLGVEYSQFKKGMAEARESVKTLNAELKANESQLKLTGDKELYLQNKIELLNKQIDAQKTVVANAVKALENMEKNGVDKASSSYQKMRQSVYNATDQLNKMQSELKDVESGADKAGKEAGEMNTQLEKIGKNVAWSTVAEGLDSITRKLESGARAAVNFGKKVLSSAKDSTQWADELQTMVAQYADMGLTSDSLQRMQKVEEFIDTPVDAILNAKQRMQRAAASDSGKSAFEEILGVGLNGQSAEDLFWETGDALMHMGEAFDKEAAAQKIFGRSWRELMPLFKTGREEYEKMLGEQTVLTEDQVDKLAKADDALKKAEQQIADLKNQFWAENADKITSLMQWFVDNEDAVVGALTAIAGAFGIMKLGSFAANLEKVISGFSSLKALTGGAAAAAGGSAAAAATGSAAGGGLASSIAGLMTSGKGLTAIGGMLLYPTIKKIAEEGYKVGPDKELMDLVGGEGTYDIYQKIQQQGLARRKVVNPDWRPSYMQGQSYYNYTGPTAISDEVIHRDRRAVNDSARALEDSLGRMSSEMTQSAAGQAQSNSEVAAAITGLTGLPAAIGAAVQAGMSQVTIVISEAAVGAIGRKAGKSIGNQVQALVK